MENIHLSTILPLEVSGQRLDQALAHALPEHSRSRLQQWIKKGYVRINNVPCTTRQKVTGGEQVDIQAQLTPKQHWGSEPIPLSIVAEDEALIVINKPVGLVSHPAAGNLSGTLVNALLHHEPRLACLPRAGLIHRLDKNTSGLLVIARTPEAHTYLVDQMQKRLITRCYEAVVNGVMTGGGSINAPIDRHPIHRTRMAVRDTGKQAITHYRVISRFRAHTHIQVQLETGRTHQIRVHMAHIRYPLVGDGTYGGRVHLPKHCEESLKHCLQHFPRQALHAKALSLVHPLTGNSCLWECEVPKDMAQLIDALKKDSL
ncbi:MAG: 23S rRNA pseudouridine(1911/1915/1917) synthase RluD [Gammaproteobacteria bacterium]